MSKKENYLSEALKAARAAYAKERGEEVSQVQFAEFLGIPQQSYSRYEQGSVPHLNVLKQIASKIPLDLSRVLGVVSEDYPNLLVSHHGGYSADLEVWRKRAKAAEKEVADIKNVLRKILGSPVSLEQPSAEEGLAAEEGDRIDRDDGGHRRR